MDGRSEARGGGREARRRARAERRHARWNRPAHPKDWRFFVGGLGRVLIVIGLLMFGFVAYQLWGTGLEYAQAQDRLEDELDELFAGVPTAPSTTSDGSPATSSTVAAIPPTTALPDVVAPTTAAPSGGAAAEPATTAGTSTTAPPATAATPPSPTSTTVPATVPVPALEIGDALARIEIPTIGLDAVVVAGVHPPDLKQGPGHYPGTPMPGQLGNSAIAGHRTTYGQPFFDLDDVERGEEIVLTTVQGRFVYRVTGREIVAPDRGDVVLTTDPTVATLTLTTCDPKYTATNRLIVYADLDTAVSGPGLPQKLDYGTPAPVLPGGELPGEPPATSVVAGVTTGAPPTADGPSGPSSAGTEPVAPATPPGTAAAAATGTGSTVDLAPAGIPADAAPDAATDADATAVDAFSQGWFSDDAAWPHVVGWALLTAAIVVGGWFVARAFQRYWVGALVAAVPFLVALYFFYQNVNRLLPAAI